MIVIIAGKTVKGPVLVDIKNDVPAQIIDGGSD